VCDFCGVYDESFNAEALDIHYWKECAVLCSCWECEQVIEIESLQDHLLEECQNAAKYT
jgi:centrosomal protein CEP104